MQRNVECRQHVGRIFSDGELFLLNEETGNVVRFLN